MPTQNDANSSVGHVSSVAPSLLPAKRDRLDAGYRVRQIGEIVTDGDYLQLGSRYYPVDGSEWVGEAIEHGGAFETVWTVRQ